MFAVDVLQMPQNSFSVAGYDEIWKGPGETKLGEDILRSGFAWQRRVYTVGSGNKTYCISKIMAKAAVGGPLPGLQSVYQKWESRNPYNSPFQTTAEGSDAGYRQVTSSGRQAWKDKFGDLGPAPVRRTRQARRRNGQQPFSIHSITNSTIGHFKVYPTELAVSGRTRPFMGRCCSCVPSSKERFYKDSLKDSGTTNILHLPASNRDLISRRFPIIAHTLSRPLKHQYANVSSKVLSSQRLTEAIQKTADQVLEQDENSKPKDVQRSLMGKAKYTLNRMKASISNKLIRLTGWFLHNLLGRLLSSILVHKGQLDMLKKASQLPVPVVYLPCHRSHLDYILLTFILYHWDIKAPHIAAGDNLNITFFGRLMKGLGGFFIRRTLDKSGRKDLVYRSILQTYMEELLCAGEDIEFFMEGGRSRSGKAVYPKGGLLSVIVESYNEGKISDALLVPVSISYEKLLDGNFNQEQMGAAKVGETFWRAWRAICRVFYSKFGHVRVDFCQPFSLKEYLEVAQSFNHVASLGSMSDTWGSQASFDDSGKRPAMQQRQRGSPTLDESGKGLMLLRNNSFPRGSDQTFYGTEIVVEDMRTTIQGLADHVIYNQMHSQAVMSTHLLAFLLLTKYRQGGSLAELMKAFDWLKAEVVNKKRDIGFIGKTSDVVAHACELLGGAVKHSETPPGDSSGREVSDDLSRKVLTPVTTLPGVFELAYYANCVSSVFINDSVLANAIYSLADPESWTNQGYDSSVVFSRQAAIQRAAHLATLLKYEYILKPPCADWETMTSECLDGFLDADIIRSEEEDGEQGGTHETQRYRSLAQSLSCADDADSDDDDGGVGVDTRYTLVKTSKESMERFWFVKGVLGPVLECYHVTACNLTLLQDGDYPESEFVKTVHNVLKERAGSGAARYNESAGMETLRNCLRAYEQLKVVDYYKTPGGGGGVRMIRLNKRYTHEEALNEFIFDVQTYRS